MDTVFQLSSLLVMPFWFLMIFLPFWRWTERILRSIWVVVPAALLYAILVIPMMPSAFADIANPSLEGISALLGSPAGATVGWVHFLAFDLFVGRWAYLDSRTHGISPWLVSPTLFLVLMFGPVGLLLYLIVRTVASQRTKAAATAAS